MIPLSCSIYYILYAGISSIEYNRSISSLGVLCLCSTRVVIFVVVPRGVMGLLAEGEGATGSQQLQSYGNYSETRLLKYISGGGEK